MAQLVGIALALLAAGPSLRAASADKPDRPSRLDKIERRLERANAAAPATRTLRDSVAPQTRPTARTLSSAASADHRAPAGANTSFDAFQLIVDRNIFDPSRIARARRTPEPPQPRVDTVALVGTLESQQATVAFFESALPEYRRTVHAGDKLGDFTVQSIQPDHVVLVRSGQPTSLRVAEQLRRPEGGNWTVSGADPSADAATDTATAAAANAPSTPPAIPADASEVLRRLMEARQKQLKQ